jgi:hypothetical protein
MATIRHERRATKGSLKKERGINRLRVVLEAPTRSLTVNAERISANG